MAALATLLARLCLPPSVGGAELAWFGPDRLGALLADAGGTAPRRLALNAEAARIDVNGVPCEPGRLRRIESAGGAPILVRPRFFNSGEVKWVAAGEGRVCVAAESRVTQGVVASRASLPFEADVPRYATGAAQAFSPGPEAKGQEIMLHMRCELEGGEHAAPVPFGQAWSASAAFGLPDFGADPAGGAGVLQLGQYRVIERRPLAGGTQHVQGLAMAPGRVWVSSVDLDRRGGRIAAYPETGGPPLAEALLGDGELVHPGGMQWADGRIWVPLAAYRPSGPSRILALDAATLRVESAFAVGDHIGAVAVDAGAGRLFGVNWDARRFYVWDMTGAMLARIDALFPRGAPADRLRCNSPWGSVSARCST